MRKIVLSLVLAAVMAVSFTGCGDDSTHEISKTSDATSTSDADDTADADASDANEEAEESGYVFTYKGTDIYPDQDMADVLSAIGEANAYFESASCAFENELDKTYTYSGFQISTYPTDGNDYVNYILLTDDTVATPEGVRIGASESEVTAAYGDATEATESMLTYELGGMKLSFSLSDGTVTAIQYLSTALD